MLDTNQRTRCARCAKDVLPSEVRIQPDGRFVCRACLGVPASSGSPAGRILERRFSYQCPQCRYQFRRSAEHTPRGCPQCGHEELLRFEPDKLTSERMLRIADDPRLERYEGGQPDLRRRL